MPRDLPPAASPTPAARLADWAAKVPADIALRFLPDGEGYGTTLSFAEFDRRVTALAGRFANAICQGETALLVYPAGLDFPIAFVAALRAGVVAVAVAVPDSEGERAALMEAARLTGARHFLTVSAALPRLPTVAGGWMATDGPQDHGAPATPFPPPAPEAIAYLQLTSGTTGAPRAVAITHRALSEQLAIYTARGGEQVSTLTFVGWLPHGHDFGLVGFFLAALWLGRPLVFMPPRAFLRRPMRWLEAISRHRGSFTGAPPFAYDLCAAAAAAAVARAPLDLSSLKIAALGGDYVAPATLQRFTRAFAPEGFDPAAWLPAYGLAEAVLSVTARRGLVVTRFAAPALADGVARPARTGGVELVACGQTGAGQHLSITDPGTGRALGPGRVGEIRVAGASLAAKTSDGALCDAEGWLATGDLGFVHDGELYVTGRAGDRIVLRGKTHAPEAIEATATSAHPALCGMGAALIEGAGGPHLFQEIPRASATNAVAIQDAITAAVTRDHGIALADLSLLRPNALPRSATGKIARARARDMAREGSLRGLATRISRAPAPDQRALTATETALLAAAQGLLPKSTIAVQSDLLAAGLDSLAAEALLSCAEDLTGRITDLATLLAAPTIAALARSGEPPSRSDAEARQGFNATQTGIAIAEALAPAATTGLFTNLMVLDLPAGTDFAAVKRALSCVMSAHAALRQVRAGQELLLADLPLPLVQVRLPRGLRLADHLADLRAKPFDRLLWRAEFHGTGRRPRVVFAAHHLIADGRSLALIAGALADQLSGMPLLAPHAAAPLPIAPSHAAPPPADWCSPASPVGGPVSLDARSLAFTLPRTLRTCLASAAQTHGATLFQVLMAAAFATLYRFSGQDRITLGFDAAGREGLGRSEVIGCTNRLAAMTLALDAQITFATLIARTRAAIPEALLFSPLAEPGSGRPFAVNALINYLRLPPPRAGLSPRFDLEVASLRFSPFGLVLDIRDPGEGHPLWVGLSCNRALFPGDWAQSFAAGFRTLARAVLLADDVPIARVPLVAGPLRPVAEGRAPPAYVPLVPAIFALAEAAPDLPAIAFAGGVWTRGELCRRSARIAAALGRHGPGRVGVLLPRGPDLIAAILAVFATGNTVVALDTDLPDARLLANARAGALDLLVTDPAGRARNLGLAPAVVDIDTLPAGGARVRPASPEPGAPAYVVFTSGTTGAPKPVLVHHGGMVNHLAAKVTDLGIGPENRVAQTAPVCFDIFLWQCLAPLVAGGTCQILNAIHPLALLRQADAARVSHLQLVPAALEEALALPASDLPGLRHLRWMIVTGETLASDLCRRWISHYPRVPVMNAYGPAECADDVAHHAVHWPSKPGEVRVSIGGPIAGARFFLVDSVGNPVPAGAPGELVVGGTPVGLGYPGLDEATARAFPADPSPGGGRLYRTGDLCLLRPDGTLDLLGRIDRQIKPGGVRIEPAAIEHVLREIPGIGAARVGVRSGPGGGDRLVAWLVARPGTHAPEPGRIRALALGLLPRAMVPVAYVYLDRFPRLPSGKVDETALPDPPSAAPAAPAPPQGEFEERLASLWAAALGGCRPGRNDDFFDLGGTSLLATRVMLDLEEAIGQMLPVTQIFKTPTLAGLAAALNAFRAAEKGEAR